MDLNLTGPRLSRVVSGVVVLVSLTVLCGWALDADALRRALSNSVAMNPMTAVALMLAAASLWFSAAQKMDHNPPAARGFRRAVLASAGLVALIGLARLIAYAAGWPSAIDNLLFAAKLRFAENGQPNRMAPNTALDFVLIGLSLLFLEREDRLVAQLSQALLLIVVLTSFIACLGHIFDAPGLYQPTPYIGMAAHTAACFVLLGLGVLAARSDRGLAAVVASPGLGGIMARQLLPVALLVPVIFGWLRLRGEVAGLYDMRLGLGLMVIVSVTALVLVILKTAVSMNHIDEERVVSAQRLAHALDLSESGVLSIDQDQRITYLDDRAERIFGYASKDLLGKPLDQLLPSRFAQAHRHHVKDFAASPETARLMGQRREVYGRREDGSEFPAEVAISKSIMQGGTAFTAVMRDVTERKKAEQEVLRSERLAAANKELEAFSYSVSHDLRAPLRHIDGFIELLGRRASPVLDEQSRNYLATISDSAKRMGMLIDDLLSFSRMAREEMRKARLSLTQLAQETMRGFEAEGGGRRITWKIGELPEAEGDPSMIRLVFVNLIGNAIKFTRTREEPIIEIGSRVEAGRLVIFVRDNGVGFDMQYAHKLFGVFQRLHRQEDFEGTGIGLANIRRIIQRHGGETWAEGEVGKGASFYFSLPGAQEIKA